MPAARCSRREPKLTRANEFPTREPDLRITRKSAARVASAENITTEDALDIIGRVPISDDSMTVDGKCHLAVAGESVAIDVNFVLPFRTNAERATHLFFQLRDWTAYPGMTSGKQPRKNHHAQEAFHAINLRRDYKPVKAQRLDFAGYNLYSL